jgi:hypothetical protein
MNVQRYELPMFKSKQMQPNEIPTPDGYVAKWLEGQHTTVCFNLLGFIYAGFCYCQTRDAQLAHSTRNYPQLLANLECIKIWNIVQWVFLIIGMISNSRNII